MRTVTRLVAATGVALAVAGGSLAVDAPLAEAASCRVNHYVVEKKSPLFAYPSRYFVKYKYAPQRVTGPNSNVMPNVYSTYYRIVYRGDGSLGFMPKGDLRYVRCS
ncbi:MAG TPA: hypothetical protein VFU98_14905 [Microlunatus sp.]|nr:hypothetical protein [Microlunatus sp.]